MTTSEMIQTSADEDRTVRALLTEEQIEELLVECQDHTDRADFWGVLDDGRVWRVAAA